MAEPENTSFLLLVAARVAAAVVAYIDDCRVLERGLTARPSKDSPGDVIRVAEPIRGIAGGITEPIVDAYNAGKPGRGRRIHLPSEASKFGAVRAAASPLHLEHFAARRPRTLGDGNLAHPNTSQQARDGAPSRRFAAGQRHKNSVPPPCHHAIWRYPVFALRVCCYPPSEDIIRIAKHLPRESHSTTGNPSVGPPANRSPAGMPSPISREAHRSNAFQDAPFRSPASAWSLHLLCGRRFLSIRFWHRFRHSRFG